MKNGVLGINIVADSRSDTVYCLNARQYGENDNTLYWYCRYTVKILSVSLLCSDCF